MVLVVTDTDATPIAYLLAGILPAVVAPIGLYPFARANARLRRMRTELERVARTDVLTNLPNRRGFFQASEAILARAVAPPATIALLMADVDHFKTVNDTNGHDAGDTMLQIVGETIRDSVALTAANDWTVARLGGEEFVALVEGLVPSAVGRLAERICQSVRKIEVSHRGEVLDHRRSASGWRSGPRTWTSTICSGRRTTRSISRSEADATDGALPRISDTMAAQERIASARVLDRQPRDVIEKEPPVDHRRLSRSWEVEDESRSVGLRDRHAAENRHAVGAGSRR